MSMEGTKVSRICQTYSKQIRLWDLAQIIGIFS